MVETVFFEKELIGPEKMELDNDVSGLAIIEAFLDAIPNLKADEWMEAEMNLR